MGIWTLFRIPDGPRFYMEQLAEWIFTVCPNAAPVERFFSLLKRILAPSRSCLTDTNLMNTAELNMFIMNKYESKGTLPEHPQWRKRHFIDSARPAPLTTSEANPPTSLTYGASAPAADSAHSASLSSFATLVTAPSVRSAAPPSLTLPQGGESLVTSTAHAGHQTSIPASSSTSMMDPSPGVITGDSDQASSSESNDELLSIQDIVWQLTQASAESEKQPAEGIPRARSQYGEPFRLSLDATFNFESTYWADTMERLGLRGLEEELEAQGMLDLDAGSEDDCEELRACN